MKGTMLESRTWILGHESESPLAKSGPMSPSPSQGLADCLEGAGHARFGPVNALESVRPRIAANSHLRPQTEDPRSEIRGSRSEIRDPRPEI